MTKFVVSDDFKDALKNRYLKYFRFDNSKYWKQYYATKLKSKDVSREKKYADIIFRHIGNNAKVLDVGCGLGFLAKEMDKIGLRVTGLDLFDGMLKAGRSYLSGTGVNILKSDILKYTLPDKSSQFDCVTLISIIEHFPEAEVRDDLFPKISSLLKPNGYLFVHFPVKTLFSRFVRRYRKMISRDLPNWAIDDDGDITHKMWLTYESYINFIEDNGYKLLNYDFNFIRSNQKPLWLSKLMKSVSKRVDSSDDVFVTSITNEPVMVKLMKRIRSHFALTSYMLFEKVI